MKAALFFAFLGPPTIPLPTVPLTIRDVHESYSAPPAKALDASFASNTDLKGATTLFNNTIQSSESVLLNDDGSLLLLDKYGYAWVATEDSAAPSGYSLHSQPLGQMGPGRPLGFKKFVDGSILVCNAGVGLMKFELPDTAAGTPGRVTILGSYVSRDSPVDPDTQIMYANALDISADGSVVYFTDSQAVPVLPNWGAVPKRVKPWYDTYTSFLMGLYSGHATGRILAYYPNNGSIHVISKGYWFPNGISLTPEQDALIIAETNMFRLLRLWIKGPKAGKAEVFTAELPGFPDGVTLAKGGKGYWVALPSPHTPLYDWAVKIRGLRVLLAWMPPKLKPPVPTWGAVALVGLDGSVDRLLLDTNRQVVSHVSDVEEQTLRDGRTRLWMGSVKNSAIYYLDL